MHLELLDEVPQIALRRLRAAPACDDQSLGAPAQLRSGRAFAVARFHRALPSASIASVPVAGSARWQNTEIPAAWG
jgi:hypothetical protein